MEYAPGYLSEPHPYNCTCHNCDYVRKLMKNEQYVASQREHEVSVAKQQSAFRKLDRSNVAPWKRP